MHWKYRGYIISCENRGKGMHMLHILLATKYDDVMQTQLEYSVIIKYTKRRKKKK